MVSIRSPRIAAVVAHPDDESYALGGTLARCVSNGAQAFVIAATRGEGGLDDTGAERSGDVLAAVRTAELGASCRALGAEPPRFLDLPDGGVEAHEKEGRERLAALFGSIDPDVVLTLGPDGAYGHRDHLACTRIVSAVAGDRRVLHAAFPRGVFAPVWELMKRVSPEVLAIGDPASLGTDRADLVVPVAAMREKKLASIAAHRSQVRDGDPLRFLVDGLVEELLVIERFVLASGPPLPAGAMDPFEGLGQLRP